MTKLCLWKLTWPWEGSAHHAPLRHCITSSYSCSLASALPWRANSVMWPPCEVERLASSHDRVWKDVSSEVMTWGLKVAGASFPSIFLGRFDREAGSNLCENQKCFVICMVHACLAPERDGKCRCFGRWVHHFVNDGVNEKGLNLFKCFQHYETGNR